MAQSSVLVFFRRQQLVSGDYFQFDQRYVQCVLLFPRVGRSIQTSVFSIDESYSRGLELKRRFDKKYIYSTSVNVCLSHTSWKIILGERKRC